MKGYIMNNQIDNNFIQELNGLKHLEQNWSLDWISKLPYFGDDTISIILDCTIDNVYLFEVDLATLESIGGTVKCTKPSKEGKAAKVSFVIYDPDETNQTVCLAKLFYLLAIQPTGTIESA